MKKLILIISMAFASSLAFAQNSTDKTLYIIDGVVSQKSSVDELPKELISNMDVIKGVESVVVITTKATETPVVIGVRSVQKDELADDSEHQSVATITYRSTTPVDVVKADPLCIIKKPDGEISKGNLESITPDQIKSIHVFKDNSVDAYKKYGDTSNGVILIELK